MVDEDRDGRIARVEYGNMGSVPNFPGPVKKDRPPTGNFSDMSWWLASLTRSVSPPMGILPLAIHDSKKK